jgi:hypothetical protein
MSLYNAFKIWLIWWLLQLMGHINIFMDENKPKSHPTDKMKFSIVVKVTKIVEISSYNCKYSQT